MVARLAKAASADYYVHSQASFRPPDDYYLSGEEPDGIWWNPTALFTDGDVDTSSGSTIDSADFYKLYNGFDPRTGDKLTRNAGKANRCPAYDLTFNADKTVSALWAIAPADLRAEIETAHNEAVRAALEDTVHKHCGYTRICDKDNNITVVPADIMAALFQHGASRANDPHLHTHCVILNVARTHHDGKWRALHGNPLFSWPKAAGAAYRAELAWIMRTRLGIEMETHGDEHELTRIKEMPEQLVEQWSKRDTQINDTAARFGVSLKGNRAFHDAVQRATRIAKQHGVDPETRHANWKEEANEHFEDLELDVQALTGHEFELTDEHREEIANRIEELPALLSDKEAVFKYTHVFEKTLNATAGLLPREERQALFEKVLSNQEIVELDRPGTHYDAGALLPHARTYTSAHNLQTEKKINQLSAHLVAARGFGLSDEILNDKIEALKADDYPTSEEQTEAMRAATRPGRIAIIEGAAGSGKTTTLRPIADLYREHGHRVIATAVPWAVTLELGTDLDAPNWCVDKLIALTGSGKLRIDPKTVIFVDEAGMLASSQALKILQIARENGAKIVFAGDTQQQQPVQAGPGLRLIRDVAKSTRVDTIRRQKPDMEDILIAVHDEDPKDARLRAMSATDDEKQAIFDEYEAIPEDIKPTRRPWQVVASENFRDGKAAEGIAAYDLRGRFHIERDLHRTLSRLVDDWHVFQTERPDKSSAIIAYSNAEVRAISFLIRERVLKDSDGPSYTVQACRSRSPRARPEPLEIAVGDRLRAGALNWSKKIFNGTYMTVLELEEREPARENPDEPRLWIRARTDRGRIVEFHHDEIRDYHGKVRLDHGYAMTMTSAQGLTVDRAFVFANQKPSRETVYPAFTRHRERLDIYIDRKPVELDIRQQRNEETAGDPVTDDEVREYLARNWSRERPKEAAKDYMSDEMRQRHFSADSGASASPDPSANAARERRRTDPDGRSASQWLKANDAGDGRLADVATRIRYSEIRVRHGLAAETLGRACNKLTAALRQWDRDRAERGNAAIAMDPAFRRDLGESAAILRAMTPFILDNPLHARLLREHGGIEVSDLKAFASSHARAVSIQKLSQSERREIDPDYRPAAPPRDHAAELLSAVERSIDKLEPEHGLAEKRVSDRAIQGAVPSTDADTAPAPSSGIQYEFDWEPDYDSTPQPQDIPPHDPGRDAVILPDNPAYDPAPPEYDFQPGFAPDEGLAAGDGFMPHLDPGHATEFDAGFDAEPPSPHTGRAHDPAEAETAHVAKTRAPSSGRAADTPAATQGEAAAAPSPAALIAENQQRISDHIDAAREAGVPALHAPGWDELERDLRGLLDHPALQPSEREFVEQEIRNVDTAWETLRTAETRHDRTRDIPDRDRAPDRDIPAEHVAGVAASPHHTAAPDGQTDAHANARDASRPDIAAQRTAPQPGLADSPAEAPSPAPNRSPEPPTSKRQDIQPSPAMDAHPGPSTAERIDHFNQRLQNHRQDAAEAGLHIFDVPGWNGLRSQLNDLARLPDLAPNQRDFVTGQLHELRMQQNARDQAETEFGFHIARRDEFAENDYGRHMPKQLRDETRDQLNREGLALANNPALSDSSRMLLLETCDQRRYLEILEARRAAEAQRKEAELAAQQDPEALYADHLQRRDAHNQAILDPSSSARIGDTTSHELRREGLDIAELPGLPADARLDLLRAYDARAYLAETARNALEANTAREPSARSEADIQQERYRSFADDLSQHVDRARELQRHPYETPGWPQLSERCQELLNSSFLTSDQQARLANLDRHHREWQQEQASQIRMPFEDDRSPSRGISF